MSLVLPQPSEGAYRSTDGESATDSRRFKTPRVLRSATHLGPRPSGSDDTAHQLEFVRHRGACGRTRPQPGGTLGQRRCLPASPQASCPCLPGASGEGPTRAQAADHCRHSADHSPGRWRGGSRRHRASTRALTCRGHPARGLGRPLACQCRQRALALAERNPVPTIPENPGGRSPAPEEGGHAVGAIGVAHRSVRSSRYYPLRRS